MGREVAGDLVISGVGTSWSQGLCELGHWLEPWQSTRGWGLDGSQGDCTDV